MTVAKEGALFSAEDIAMGETQETASNSKQNTESVEVLESGTSEMSAKTDDPNASDAAKVDQASVYDILIFVFEYLLVLKSKCKTYKRALVQLSMKLFVMAITNF